MRKKDDLKQDNSLTTVEETGICIVHGRKCNGNNKTMSYFMVISDAIVVN